MTRLTQWKNIKKGILVFTLMRTTAGVKDVYKFLYYNSKTAKDVLFLQTMK